MSVTVRPLEPSDRADWGRLWEGYLAFYETERPAAHFDAYFRRLLVRDPADMQGLIAEVDGRAAGLAHYLFHPHGWQAEPTCYLQDLFADPAVRGAGVGRALIEAVYAAADAGGARGVYWTTAADNRQARQLYDRIGRLTPFVKYARA